MVLGVFLYSFIIFRRFLTIYLLRIGIRVDNRELLLLVGKDLWSFLRKLIKKRISTKVATKTKT